RMLVVMGADGDHELVDEMPRAAHDIDVTVGDGIEASRIKPDAHVNAPRRDGPFPRAIHLLAARRPNRKARPEPGPSQPPLTVILSGRLVPDGRRYGRYC